VRIARVLYKSSDEISPLPVLALERDGALYAVSELERVFGTQFSPERLAGTGDFHTRAVALGGAGLEDLDDRLRAGDRPSAARIVPGSFAWLPPCDTDRALYVQLAGDDEPWSTTGLGAAEPGSAPYPGRDGPLHRFGDARGLVGHEGAVPFPPGEGRPCFELGIAAVLREDLEGAGSAEAARAILGYAILDGWSGRDEEARPGTSRVPAQLGPVLVTPGEVGDPARLKAQVRVDGTIAATPGMGGGVFSLAESIAWVSRWHQLRAGDVIGVGCVQGGRGDVTYGATVELHVEKLGKLAGRAVRRGVL
jgi:hypothetical protein